MNIRSPINFNATSESTIDEGIFISLDKKAFPFTCGDVVVQSIISHLFFGDRKSFPINDNLFKPSSIVFLRGDIEFFDVHILLQDLLILKNVPTSMAQTSVVQIWSVCWRKKWRPSPPSALISLGWHDFVLNIITDVTVKRALANDTLDFCR